LPLTAQADGLPLPNTDTLSDFANVFSATERVDLITTLRGHRADTDVQMVVVTMRHMMGANPGESVERYATRLFNAWGVGDAARDDGVMILVVTGDRTVRIALGAGFPQVYDARAVNVIDVAMLPNFRKGQMVAGLFAGVALARTQLIDPFLAGGPMTADQGFFDPAKRILLWLIGIVGGGGVLLFGGQAAWTAYKRCPQCGGSGLLRRNEVLIHATRQSSGNGITHFSCSLCSYTDSQAYTISRINDRDRSSGGGGGFGGGRSSGGGGTGRW
jgi:uncharacterized protein